VREIICMTDIDRHTTQLLSPQPSSLLTKTNNIHQYYCIPSLSLCYIFFLLIKKKKKTTLEYLELIFNL
jgi:hypothetical protein